MRVGLPKTQREERASILLGFLLLYICFLPWRLPFVNWVVHFTWGPHSSPWTFLCSIFTGFSHICLLAAAILDSFFLFYLSNISMIQRMLAIWSLVLLPFLNSAGTFGSSQFMYWGSLAWRILSITLLACEMSTTEW